MTKKPETKLQERIQKALRAKYGTAIRVTKVYVGPFQQAGVSDLLICINGMFIAMEVKMPGEEPSKIQWKFIKDIRKAGGVGTYVTTVKEALDVVGEALVSKASGRVHSSTPGVMSILRSGDGEDLRDVRSNRARVAGKPARLSSTRRLP